MIRRRQKRAEAEEALVLHHRVIMQECCRRWLYVADRQRSSRLGAATLRRTYETDIVWQRVAKYVSHGMFFFLGGEEGHLLAT